MRKNLIKIAPDKFIVVLFAASVIGFLFGLPVGFQARGRIVGEDFSTAPAQELPVGLPIADIRRSLRDEALATLPELGGVNVMASYYGELFHGRQTANWKDRELFDMEAMTAAHRTLPFGTIIFVENHQNGRFALVQINDRGPFIRDRELDVSRAVAESLGMIESGVVPVRIKILRRGGDGR